MKNIFKNILKLTFICIFFTISSCEKDLYEDTIQKSNHKKITLNQFKEETNISSFETTKRINQSIGSNTAKGVYFSDFYIDTEEIIKHISEDNKTTYSFRIIPLNFTPEVREKFNLVYRKENNVWVESIISIVKKETIGTDMKKYESIEEVYDSFNLLVQTNKICLGEMFYIECDGSCEEAHYDHCDGFGCPTGECVRSTIVTVPCTGGGDGGDNSGTDPSDPSDPNTSSGGTSSGDSNAAQPRNPYEFDPNLGSNNSLENPNASNQYIANNFFHNDLYLPQQQWAEAHPDEYIEMVNYMITNRWSVYSKYFVNELINVSITLEIDAFSAWNDYDNFVGQMSISEKGIFENLPANRKLWYIGCAKKALDKAAELFPANSLHNGKGDAFRHALWNGLCALTLSGNLGEQLTTAHENKPSEYPFNYKETEMDLYNNEKGRQIAVISSLSNIVDDVYSDLENGYLRYLNNLDSNNLATYNSILIPTDQ